VSRYGDTIRVIGDPDELEGSALQSDGRWTATPQWAVVAPGPVTKVATVRPFDSTHSVDSISARSRDLSGIPQVRRGILIHAMLAGLPGVAAHERLAAATRYLLRQRVPEGEIRALAAKTLAVIEDPVFADAFAPGSRSEVPIAAELAELGPGRQIEGRLDRLAVTDSEVLIVDFKTDRAAPDREDDVASRYVTQMALYRAAITKLFPLHRIDCALLWTEEPRLMKLSNERLDAALATVRARLDPRGGTP
jgi:ATP-dependent helicase/nuclease subunit A